MLHLVMLPFGQSLLLWRSSRNLTQGELARLAGIPRPNLSNMERGKKEVSLKTIRALASALGVTPGTLVDGKAPGEKLSRPLSRSALERIANAVAFKKSVKNPVEREIAERLKNVLQRRMAALKMTLAKSKKSGRASERAWLSLAQLPPGVVDSLIQRIADRAHLSEPRPNRPLF